MGSRSKLRYQPPATSYRLPALRRWQLPRPRKVSKDAHSSFAEASVLLAGLRERLRAFSPHWYFRITTVNAMIPVSRKR
jgi:hypothetical protein